MPLPHLFQIDLFLTSAKVVPNRPLSGICKSADVALCLQAHGGAAGKQVSWAPTCCHHREEACQTEALFPAADPSWLASPAHTSTDPGTKSTLCGVRTTTSFCSNLEVSHGLLRLLIFVNTTQDVRNFIKAEWSIALLGCSVNAYYLMLETGALFIKLSCNWPGVQDIP